MICHLIFTYSVPPRVELNARMLKGLKVKAGATILLEAEVFGKPMPRVTWRRGDDSLKSGEGQVITHHRHHFQLELSAVTKEHTGTYTIVAENASGSKTAEIQVDVLGEYESCLFEDCSCTKHTEFTQDASAICLQVDMFHHENNISLFFKSP